MQSSEPNEIKPPQLRSDRRVVLIGSMGVYGKMVDIAKMLSEHGVNVIIPEAESSLIHQLSLFDFEEFKRNVSFAYLRKIRDPKTYAVLAINLDQHKILNYIGPNTFAELAVAFAQSKKMYIFQSVPDAYADELSAWKTINLLGDLTKLIEDFRRDCMVEDSQLRFPGL
ncbi:hypothetical protein QQ994_09980 [Pseudomonas asiatica]|uniref:hypothetical protein n=1 Tax=Pseudomonas asiatica TaxID=2219225 RepID=UPI00256FB381|nr:hypothetical protein [Pseudomonas asiatica]WJD72162.1 hypothetical protein QQ994_09980 [Pseudomonas asiatica]